MSNKLLVLLVLCASTSASAAYFNELSFPQNACLMGPSVGGSGPATARALVGADLPVPSATTLGGIESLGSVAHNWIDSISTSGVPHASQPAFSDISGSVAASQLPNPSATTLGGIESIASSAHNWIDSISTSGVPHLSQPAFSDISGTLSSSQLPAGVDSITVVSKSGAYTAVAGDVVLANASGGAFSVTLPAAASNSNKIIRIKKVDSSANIITVAASGVDLIDGAASQSIPAQYDGVELISDGTNWDAF